MGGEDGRAGQRGQPLRHRDQAREQGRGLIGIAERVEQVDIDARRDHLPLNRSSTALGEVCSSSPTVVTSASRITMSSRFSGETR